MEVPALGEKRSITANQSLLVNQTQVFGRHAQ